MRAPPPPTSGRSPTPWRSKPRAWRPKCAGSSPTCRPPEPARRLPRSKRPLQNARRQPICQRERSPWGPRVLRILKLSLQVLLDAIRQFLADDGWAIASHIALSTLMAMFPFLIVVTALAGFFFGSRDLADEAAKLLLEAWPKQVAAPIALDIAGVLTSTRGDVLTLGVLFAL